MQVNLCYFGSVTNLFENGSGFRFFLVRLSQIPLEPMDPGFTG
jgi:hypothetical protein